MFGHDIGVFGVIFHAVIFQDQGSFFTAFGIGHEKIYPVFWYLSGVFSLDVFADLELGDNLDMLPVRFYKICANQKVVQVFFRRRIENSRIFYKKVTLSVFVKNFIVMFYGISKPGFALLINRHAVDKNHGVLGATKPHIEPLHL